MSQHRSPAPSPSARRRRGTFGRNAIVGMTAAGIILTGPTSAAFAADATGAEAGTFGQEIDPVTGAPVTGTSETSAYPAVEQLADQALTEQAPVAQFAGTVAPVPATTDTAATGDAAVLGTVDEQAAADAAAAETTTAASTTLAPAVLAPATPVIDPFVQMQIAAEEVTDPDTDGDGIPDSQDAYPTDPMNGQQIDTGVGPAPEQDSDGDGIPDSQDAYPTDPTNTAPAPEQQQPVTEEPATGQEPAPEQPAAEEPAPEEPADGGDVAHPAPPQQTAYNDENTTVEVPEQYRGADSGYSFVLVGDDGSSVPVTLDEQGRAVLTPKTLEGLGEGTYALRAVQGENTSADISTIHLVDPVTAPASELAPTVTTGSDLIGTIGDYAKGQKIVVRDADGKAVEGLNVTISDNGFYVVEGLTDGGYTLEVIDADGKRLTERAPVQLTAPAEDNAPVLQAPEEITAGEEIAIGGTGYETDVKLNEDGSVKSYGTVKVKVTDPVTGAVVDEKIVELNEDGSFDYALDTDYSADGFSRLVITVTERDGTSTTRTELVNVEGNGTPQVTAPDVVIGNSPAVGGSKLIPGEEYTFRVTGPGRDTTVTLVAGEDGKAGFRLADDLRTGEYTVEVTNANGAPVPGQSSTFRVQSDSDGDGIADENDHWDGPGATMPDRDGDGIEDSQDGWDGPGATMPDRDGDGIEDSRDNWDGPGANEPDSDGDGIPDSRDGYNGPGATMPDRDGDGIHDDIDFYDGPGSSAPIIVIPPVESGPSNPGPVDPAPPVGEVPVVAPPETTDPGQGETPVVTVPIGEETGPVAPVNPGEDSIGTPAPVLAAPESGDAPQRGNSLTIQPVSLVEKIFGGGDDENQGGSGIVNNLEQRLDASPVRDVIERVTGMDFSRDLSERGNFQAAPNLGDVLERVSSAAPGLDSDPVPMAAGAQDEETDAPEVLDLRDAAPRAAERAGGLSSSDAFGPVGLAILGLAGLGAVAGTTYVVVRRGGGVHRA